MTIALLTAMRQDKDCPEEQLIPLKRQKMPFL